MKSRWGTRHRFQNCKSQMFLLKNNCVPIHYWSVKLPIFNHRNRQIWSSVMSNIKPSWYHQFWIMTNECDRHKVTSAMQSQSKECRVWLMEASPFEKPSGRSSRSGRLRDPSINRPEQKAGCSYTEFPSRYPKIRSIMPNSQNSTTRKFTPNKRNAPISSALMAGFSKDVHELLHSRDSTIHVCFI